MSSWKGRPCRLVRARSPAVGAPGAAAGEISVTTRSGLFRAAAGVLCRDPGLPGWCHRGLPDRGCYGGPWQMHITDSLPGHGLDIVGKLACDWGVDGGLTGWTAWARLDWPRC